MVYFKITDGDVTRKFTVNPGEVSFEQLQSLVCEHFPEAGPSKDLHLKYRDADGDIITISTDREFQEALSELPKDHVWKLHIHGAATTTGPAKPRRQTKRDPIPSSFFFQPSHTLFPHHHQQIHHQQIQRQHSPWQGSSGGSGGAGSSSSATASGSRSEGLPSPWSGFWGSPWHGWSSLDKEFDRMLGEHTLLLNALHNESDSAEPSTTTADYSSDSARPEFVAKSWETKEVTPSEMPDVKIKNFGSWEPRTFEGPYGKGRIIGMS